MSDLEEGTLAGFPARWTAAPEARERGTPVLLLHGTNQDHRVFDGYIRVLAASGLNPYAVSRRGRLGVPPADARGVSFSDYVDDTLRAIDALGGDVAVVGHSLGGLIAQKVAELGRCRAAVLLTPLGSREVQWRLLAPPSAVPLYMKLLPKIVRGVPFAVQPSDLAAVALNHVPASDLAGISRSFVLESGRVAREVLIGIPIDRKRVRCPVLCINALDDRFQFASVTRTVASRLRADLAEYPDHGHFIIGDAGWETIADRVARWLKQKLD